MYSPPFTSVGFTGSIFDVVWTELNRLFVCSHQSCDNSLQAANKRTLTILSTNCIISSSNPNQQISPDQDLSTIIPTYSAMQFSTIVISAITVIASVHGASIPAPDASAPSQVALEARSYNDPNSGSNLEKRSPGYGT
ncbi:hypothetical protein BASA61_000526 [Batrachochytrium salamandrivorans]|nr:hypothetical protein BASA61_000526 [Batrachochytrium salamandrivorans]